MKKSWKKKIDSVVSPVTIKKRLFFIFSLVLLPLIATGIYLTHTIRAEIVQSKEKDVLIEMDRLKKNVEDNLNSVVLISDWIYQDTVLPEVVLKEYHSVQEVVEQYENYHFFEIALRYYKNISNIRFFVDNPTLLSNSNFLLTDEATKKKAWYQEAIETRGKVQWRTLIDPITQKEYLTLVRSVWNSENTFLGVLCLYVDDLLLEDITDSATVDNQLLLDKTTVFTQENSYFSENEKTIQRMFSEGKKEEGFSESEDKQTGAHFYQEPLQVNRSNLNTFMLVTMMNQEEILTEVNNVMMRSYFLMGGILFVVFLLIWIFTKIFNQRINLLSSAMEKVAKGDFTIAPEIKGSDEITQIYAQLYETMGSLSELLEERYAHEMQEKNWQLQQKESEFKLLASQINPHFLYNTLEMIRMKAVKNQDLEVAESVKILSKLLRRSLESNQSRMIYLEEELEFVRLYLRIQQIRFGEKVQFQILRDIQTTDYQVLPLIIQPIVENAFIHGIERQAKAGNLLIHVREEADTIYIDVMDNGIGIPGELLKTIQELLEKDTMGNRIGLNNVNQRIKRFYGENYGITIKSIEHKGTTVTIFFPKVKGELL